MLEKIDQADQNKQSTPIVLLVVIRLIPKSFWTVNLLYELLHRASQSTAS